jgi:hypothetical protein
VGLLGFLSGINSHVRDVTVELLSMVLLLTQSLNYGYHIEESSVESRDINLAKDLFEWTDAELTKKGY